MQSSLRPSSVCSTKLGEHGIRAGDIMGTTSSKSQAPSIHNLLSCRLRRKAMCLLTPGKRSSGFSIPHIQHTSDSSFSARQWIDCLNGPPRQDHPNLQQAVSHGPSEWQEEGALLATPCSVSYWTMGCYRVAGRKKEHRGIVGCNCVGNFKACLYCDASIWIHVRLNQNWVFRGNLDSLVFESIILLFKVLLLININKLWWEKSRPFIIKNWKSPELWDRV